MSKYTKLGEEFMCLQLWENSAGDIKLTSAYDDANEPFEDGSTPGQVVLIADESPEEFAMFFLENAKAKSPLDKLLDAARAIRETTPLNKPEQALVYALNAYEASLDGDR